MGHWLSSEIEDLTVCCWRRGCQKHCFNTVIDVGVVSTLLTAHDHQWMPVDNTADPVIDESVSTRLVLHHLSRTVRVRQSEAYRTNAVRGEVDPVVLLAGDV